MKGFWTLLAFAFLITQVNAQYEKGNMDVLGSVGMGLYGAKSNDTSDTKSGIEAANALFGLTWQYAATDNFSAGANYERSNFLGVDSTGYASANTFRVALSYRLVNTEKNLLIGNGFIGMSMLTYGDNGSNWKVTGSGLTFELNLRYQHMFGNRIGYFLSSGYANYRYGNLTNQDGNTLKASGGNKDLVLILPGANTRLGVVCRF